MNHSVEAIRYQRVGVRSALRAVETQKLRVGRVGDVEHAQLRNRSAHGSGRAQ